VHWFRSLSALTVVLLLVAYWSPEVFWGGLYVGLLAGSIFLGTMILMRTPLIAGTLLGVMAGVALCPVRFRSSQDTAREDLAMICIGTLCGVAIGLISDRWAFNSRNCDDVEQGRAVRRSSGA